MASDRESGDINFVGVTVQFDDQCCTSACPWISLQARTIRYSDLGCSSGKMALRARQPGQGFALYSGMDSSPGPTTAPAGSGSGAWTPIPEQLAIIEAAPHARVLVVAPPGTGKTAVACGRAAYLIRELGVASSNILIISFTRTAVAEIRARIGQYVGNAGQAAAIAISTVDSHAWSLQQGFGEETSGVWKDGDYDLTIQQAIELLRRREPDIQDYLSRFEHVIVDEAQDLVGIRLDLVSELTKCLPKTCGVTVFADFLQAIYDFANGTAAADAVTSDVLRGMLGAEFIEMRLTRLHRFKNEQLAAVLTSVRTLMESKQLPPTQLRQCVRQLLEQSKVVKPVMIEPWKVHEIPKIAELDDLLILFRTRAEVLCASDSLTTRGIRHRVRMSGLPDCAHAWLGRVFMGFRPSGLVLERREFDERIAATVESGVTSDSAWELLQRLARKQSGVDPRKLRLQLSRARPPVEACFLDLGSRGPTLGTVHASKGRESNRVLYCLPPEGSDTFEEARIDYVAMTRGSSSVRIGSAFKYPSASLQEDSGRVFRHELSIKVRTGAKIVHMEVGRGGDLIEESVVAGDQALEVQQHLWTTRDDVLPIEAGCTSESDWQYDITEAADVGPVIGLGRLSKSVRNDAFSVAKTLSNVIGGKWTPGTKMSGLYRIAARTVVLREDDPRLGSMPQSIRDTGYFLVPVLRGWCTVFCNKKD